VACKLKKKALPSLSHSGKGINSFRNLRIYLSKNKIICKAFQLGNTRFFFKNAIDGKLTI